MSDPLSLRVAIGGDHAGYLLKQAVAERLKLFEFSAAGLIAELVADGVLVPADQTDEIADPKVQISVEDAQASFDEPEIRAEDAAG